MQNVTRWVHQPLQTIQNYMCVLQKYQLWQNACDGACDGEMAAGTHEQVVNAIKYV